VVEITGAMLCKSATISLMGFSGLVCFRKPTLPEKPYFFNLFLAKVLTHNKDFLFILAEKLTNPKVISLRKDKINGSKLILFDLEKEQKLGQHQRIDDLERYLDEDYCSVQDAQEKIRLCIETALQFKYYRYLNGITTLGKILDKLKELSKIQPDLLKTLRDLNEVSSAPHHGEHKKAPLKELTRADLLPDIRKTLDILEEI
ncbi:MAG: hypothetical protein HYZ22_09075, partial [Chloroflexi bacterium]|nr:hypothetical protein [Chloroflexota bacterium]